MALKYEIPNAALLDELEQVAASGDNLLHELSKVNRLPEDFPTQALIDMVEGLAGLKNGTAEGCRAPLENAHRELRAIRFDHFISAQKAETLGDLPDKLRREEPVDAALQRFKGAIESALECYSRQAREDIDDSLPQEAKQDNPQTASTKAAIEDSRQADAAILGDIEVAHEQVNEESTAGRTYLAVLQDALNLNRYGRGLLQLPKLSREWLQPVTSAINKLPEIIRSTGRFVKESADGLRPLATTLDEFKNEPAKSTIRVLRKIGAAMERFGAATPPPVEPEIQKTAEEEAERLLTQNQPVPDDVAINVRDLDLNASEFTDSILLQNFPWLQSLNTWHTNLSNIAGLAKLSDMQRLDLGDTQIRDIAGLEKLTGLQWLSLNNTQINNIAGLEKLTGLQRLYLNNTQINNTTGLEKLTNLQRLYLNNTQINNIAGLEKLTGLQHLSLKNTQFSDIVGLKKLTGLQVLYLDNTQISDIAGLEKLTNLQRLHLTNTQVTDWSPLDHVDDVRGRPADWVRKGQA